LQLQQIDVGVSSWITGNPDSTVQVADDPITIAGLRTFSSSQGLFSTEEAIMKRERTLQIFLALLGLLFIALIYPLYTDLLHAKWLLEMHNETEPMFLSFFIALGPFLLVAARNPSAHRSLVVFTAWWNLAHAAVMTIETMQAWDRGVHRDFTDVVIVALIGLVLLVLSPPHRNASARLSP
jgi:hypothetical protein